MERARNRKNCFYKKKLLSRTLIGLKARVLLHADPSLKGVEGEVVQETKKAMIIKKSSGDKVTILKLYGLFILEDRSGFSVVVRGEDIYGTLLERLRRLRKRRVVC